MSDYTEMSDAELDADTAPAPTETPDDPNAGAPADQAGDAAQPPPEQEDRGPGDLKVALQQERDRRKAAEAAADRREREAVEARDAQWRQHLAQQQGQQAQPQGEEEGYQDPELEALATKVHGELQGFQGTVEQRLQVMTVQMSEQFARQQLGQDAEGRSVYDAKMAELVALKDGADPILSPMLKQAWPRILASSNPAMVALQVHEKLVRSSSSQPGFGQADLDAARKAGYEEAMAKLQTTPGRRGVAGLSSGDAQHHPRKPLHQWTDAELDAE